MFYSTLYLVNTHRWCDDQLLYTKKEFIQALNNDCLKPYRNFNPAPFYVYHNITSAVKYYNQALHQQTYMITAQSHHALTHQELTSLFDQADAWFIKQLQKNKQYYHLVYQSNQDPEQEAKYDQLIAQQFGPNYRPIDVQSMAAENQLGNEITDATYYYQHYCSHRLNLPKSHNNYGNYKVGGRSGHTQSTFARDNYWHKQELNTLSQEPNLVNTKIRHLNRRYHNHHPIDFPVFDDDEYIEAKTSTGWKHSSHAKHQYNQHHGQPTYIDKHQLSHFYNDWTNDDDFDAAGGDYYAEAWWYHEPNPTVTPMAEKNKYEKIYDPHDPSENL